MLVLENILLGIIIVCLLGIVYLSVMLVKVEVTSKHLNLLLDAVHAYNLDCIDRGFVTETYNYYDIFPSYDTVLNRIFDWGYENILPKEVMEKIRPFIKEVKKCQQMK